MSKPKIYEELQEEISRYVPVGSMLAFAANSIPEGYLLCNGAAVSRTTYSKLFEAIGVTYGAGDGSTTFELPDMDGRVLQGTNDVALYIGAGLPNITGSLSVNADNDNAGMDASVDGTGAFRAINKIGPGSAIAKTEWEVWGGFTFDAFRSSSIYGASDTVQPRALSLHYCIKY